MHSFCGKCHYYIVHSSKLSAFNSKDPLCIRSQVLVRKILIIFRFVEFWPLWKPSNKATLSTQKIRNIHTSARNQSNSLHCRSSWMNTVQLRYAYLSFCLPNIYRIHIFIFSFVKSKHVVLCQCLLSHSIIFFIADKTLECKYYAM